MKAPQGIATLIASANQAEEEGEDGEELAEEPTKELTGEPTVGPLRVLLKKPQWNVLLWGESHHLGVSEKLKKEWSSTHRKKRLTACVEDPVGTETGIQEDYKGDGCGHLWPCKTSTHG